jgi:hypothetical protein
MPPCLLTFLPTTLYSPLDCHHVIAVYQHSSSRGSGAHLSGSMVSYRESILAICKGDADKGDALCDGELFISEEEKGVQAAINYLFLCGVIERVYSCDALVRVAD